MNQQKLFLTEQKSYLRKVRPGVVGTAVLTALEAVFGGLQFKVARVPPSSRWGLDWGLKTMYFFVASATDICSPGSGSQPSAQQNDRHVFDSGKKAKPVRRSP